MKQFFFYFFDNNYKHGVAKFKLKFLLIVSVNTTKSFGEVEVKQKIITSVQN